MKVLATPNLDMRCTGTQPISFTEQHFFNGLLGEPGHFRRGLGDLVGQQAQIVLVLVGEGDPGALRKGIGQYQLKGGLGVDDDGERGFSGHTERVRALPSRAGRRDLRSSPTHGSSQASRAHFWARYAAAANKIDRSQDDQYLTASNIISRRILEEIVIEAIAVGGAALRRGPAP